jgi:hypothetical protein
MKLDVEHFERCINTIEKAYELLKQTDKSEIILIYIVRLV